MDNKRLEHPKVVCLGGGIGTVNLIKGLKAYTKHVAIVTSMADDGGSAGRLRRLYDTFPPGDLVSCMAAFASDQEQLVQRLLTYRFAGNRYGKDEELGGHKLGNLVLVALSDMTGSLKEAIRQFQRIFHIDGEFYPATKEHVSISAITIEGKEVVSEENIDLGKYEGKKVLDKVLLHPANASAADGVVNAIMQADALILGPGDLYTTLLPVMIVPDIAAALKETRAKKFFIINIANKPFETKGYTITDYIKAVEKHVGQFPFDIVIANNNFQIPIPKKYKYQYVPETVSDTPKQTQVVLADIVDESFPLYHCPEKLAKVVFSRI